MAASYDSVPFLIIGFGFYFLLAIGIHLLYAFGPYRMAKHAGIPHAWLGLLPIGAGWILGLLAERSLFARTGRRSRLALWTPAMQGICFCGLAMMIGLAILDSDFNGWVTLSFVTILVGGVAGTVFFYYSLYQVFRDYAPDNAVLYTVLGILFNIYFIFLLVEMNTVPVSVTGPGAFQYGRPKYDHNHRWDAPPPQYNYPQGYGGYPQNPAQPGGPYTTSPGQQPYGGTPGQPPCAGQGQQFYQGGTGYYQPQQQPYDPSRNFPGGGYDPQHPETFIPPERPRDQGPNNGPEL